MGTSVGLSTMLQKFLLFCGILAPLVYLGTDLLAGRLFKDYGFSTQSISELSAAGSPTRLLVVVLTILASGLLIAFGLGVWRMAGATVFTYIVAALILGNVVTQLIATLFFPNRIGVQPEFATSGVLLTFSSVLFFVLAMVSGALAFQGWMRSLSIAIPSAYIILAILRFATAAPSAQTSVLIGAQERTMVYSFLLWTMALAIYLLLQFSKEIESAIYSGG